MLLQVAIQLVLQILLPLYFLFELLRKRYRNRAEWLMNVGLFGLLLLFAFLAARWDWTSYYLRFLFPVLFVIASYIAYTRIGSVPASSSTKPAPMEYLVNGIFLVVMAWLSIGAVRGYFFPEDAVDLAYPLRGNVYYVGGGGTSRWINNHNAYPPQDYALDILRLNVFGNRALGLWPEELDRYAIYGDPVYSPCTGAVVRAVDGLPDQVPPEKDEVQFAGNYVAIACQDVEVVLAHLMQGSVAVSQGDPVAAGEVVGRVGNSGNTTQPHLHIHAERGGAPGEILNGVGVPIRFEGRSLVRNSLFTGD